jgi:hypothetical protein
VAACSGSEGGAVDSCCPGVSNRTGGTVAWSMATGTCGSFVNGALTAVGAPTYGYFYRDAVFTGTQWRAYAACVGGSWFVSLVDMSGAYTQVDGTIVSVNCNDAGNVVVVADFTIAGMYCTGSVRGTFTLTG